MSTTTTAPTQSPVRGATRFWLKLLVVNAAMSLALLVVALACIEIYLRATIPSSSKESLFESTTKSRRYKVMKRDASIVAWGREFRTNELGFRDSKSAVSAKRPSGFRVIVLGDSFTASAGVEFDRIYTTQLDRALKNRLPDVEVMNLAVGGYNIIQYELLLHEVGLALKPDLVLVSVFPYNDLSNETYRANAQDAMGLSKPQPASAAWRRLYVYRAFLERVENRVKGYFASPTPHAQPARRVSNPDADENLAALERLVAAAADRGIGVLITLLPNTDTFEHQRADFAPFESLCREKQWPCMNLLDRFADSGVNPKSLRLNILDSHPNERYHELVTNFTLDDLTSHIAARRGKR